MNYRLFCAFYIVVLWANHGAYGSEAYDSKFNQENYQSLYVLISTYKKIFAQKSHVAAAHASDEVALPAFCGS